MRVKKQNKQVNSSQIALLREVVDAPQIKNVLKYFSTLFPVRNNSIPIFSKKYFFISITFYLQITSVFTCEQTRTLMY